jgi:hypothetical protein
VGAFPPRDPLSAGSLLIGLDFRDEAAIWLASTFGVIAEPMSGQRAPSASGDRLFRASVPPANATPLNTASPFYQPGRPFIVRMRVRQPRHLTCDCPLGKRQGDACGHIGAVLLLLRRGG